jgi:hypothetical protein
MGLTSEQASAMAARPRISSVQEDQMVSLFAEGQSVKEVALRFPDFAQGTIANLRTRRKEQIAELRRKRSVQFEDLFIVRKQARLDDLQNQRNTADMLIREHLASCFATDPVTGQKGFVEQLVDARKLKVYVDMLDKALKLTMIETGQQVRLDDRWTERVLGLNGKNGIDYPAIVQTQREWEADAPQRAAKRAREKAVRDEWFDADWVASLVRDGTPRKQAVEAVQRERDRKNGLSPAGVKQRAMERWRAAEYVELIENLEEFCEQWIAQDLDGNPKCLDAEALERERAHLKKYWFPDDEAAHARVDRFFDEWRYAEVEEQTEEPEQELVSGEAVAEVELVPEPVLVPESEPDPEPEPDPVDPLREAFIQVLEAGGVVDDDALMRELRCGAREFFAVLGELVEDGIVVEDGTGIWLSEGRSVAVA